MSRSARRFVLVGMICAAACGGACGGSNAADPGLDAGVPDAAGVETGLADALADRPVADAGVTDTGGTDANPSDTQDAAGKVAIPSAGQIWLASTEPKPTDPKYYENRTKVEIAGTVASVAAGPAQPAADLQKFFTGGNASQVVTIVADDGIRWSLGYQIERGTTPVDITPKLDAAAGKRVRLLFRAVRAFGSAPAFILSDDAGVVLAMDLAVYGDAFQTGDVPGLVIEDGPVIGFVAGQCFDRNDVSLRFTGDATVDVAPGAEAPVSIKGLGYIALNLFSFRASSQVRCTDIVDRARGWAIVRVP